MTIYLYKCISPNNAIIKEFDGSPVELNGYLRESTSILDPVIKVQGTNLSGYNYMRIPDFQDRQYFIVGMTVDSKDIWTITAHVDVLQTYRDTIMNSYGIIKRRGNAWNGFIDEGLIPTECRKIKTKHLFHDAQVGYKDTQDSARNYPSRFMPSPWSYYLITAGPGYSEPGP